MMAGPMESPNAAKKTLCNELLEIGMVMVVVDARRSGVLVPVHLLGDPKLRLNLSFQFGAPLTIEDWGIRATLSFNKSPFDCILPWEAVYVVFSHIRNEPYVFPDDVPEEVLEEIGIDFTEAPPPQKPTLRVISGDLDAQESANLGQETTEPPQANAPEQAMPRRINTVPTAEESSNDGDPDDPPPPSPAGRPRGHLRVVK